MFKQKYRKICYNVLKDSGYKNPALYLERDGKEYYSYWGSDERRMEVICFKDSKTVHVYELKYI